MRAGNRNHRQDLGPWLGGLMGLALLVAIGAIGMQAWNHRAPSPEAVEAAVSQSPAWAVRVAAAEGVHASAVLDRDGAQKRLEMAQHEVALAGSTLPQARARLDAAEAELDRAQAAEKKARLSLRAEHWEAIAATTGEPRARSEAERNRQLAVRR